MRYYSENISLIKNKRGVYDLDTSKGCKSGMSLNKNGCYGSCYAFNNSKRYGYDFKKSVDRNFNSIEHLESVINLINNINMPFIRIGVSGDPSENWNNTLKILKLISGCKVKIVIISKHWFNLTEKQLNELSKYNIIFNTSISALDRYDLLKNRLLQFKRLKQYCKSILRIVSCDFNKKNISGIWLNDLQKMLFDNENIIDTVLRLNKSNMYIKSDLININKVKFLDNYTYASIYNKNTFLGYCKDCKELCGINL
jgi:hypothetical protein